MNAKRFNYRALDQAQGKAAQTAAVEIRDLLQSSARAVLTIGRRLVEIHALLGKTLFAEWLEAEFRWSQSLASNYMRAYNTFKDDQNALDRFQPHALFELARGRVKPEARAEALAAAKEGQFITAKAAKEIAAKHGPQEGHNAPKPEAVHKVRTALKKLMDGVDALRASMTPAEMDSLADQLFNLALALREAGRQTKPTKPAKQRMRSAARRTTKALAAAK